MKTKTILSVIATSTALSGSLSAHAEILHAGGQSLDVTGAVTDSRVHHLESNTDIFVWNEIQDYALPMAIWTDLDGTPGSYSNPGALGSYQIAANTSVDSHFVHADVISGGAVLSGDLSFPNEILGVVITCDRLDLTDTILGDPSVVYDDCFTNPFRVCDWYPGYAEKIVISPDRRSISFTLITSNASDEIRVITKADSGSAACPADFNDDNRVGIADLLSLLDAYGQCEGCPQDLDGDGRVGIADLLKVIENWGSCEG